MNNKKTNKILFVMVGACVLSGGLFAYQQFVLKNSSNETETVYVAKEYIPANSEITEDMLSTVTVPKNGVLSTYITDKNQVIGKKLSGGILKDEPLSKSRILASNEDGNNLELKIDYDNAIPLQNNDYINVYVILKDSSGDVTVQKLFNRKLVTTTTVSTSDSTESCYTIRVNEEEAINYYNAKEKGKVVVVKDKSVDGSDGITDQAFNPESDEVKNAVAENENTDSAISIVTKTFEKGDTLESLAVKYKTDVKTIQKLNNDKTDFNVGETINLPAN